MFSFINSRDHGNALEKEAALHIKKFGFDIVQKNYQCKLGEIDIIAKKDDCLVFFEVRHRKQKKFGGALESVDSKKQQKLIKTASYYLQQKQLTNRIQCRFDVIAIEGPIGQFKINWIENAFCVE